MKKIFLLSVFISTMAYAGDKCNVFYDNMYRMGMYTAMLESDSHSFVSDIKYWNGILDEIKTIEEGGVFLKEGIDGLTSAMVNADSCVALSYRAVQNAKGCKCPEGSAKKYAKFA